MKGEATEPTGLVPDANVLIDYVQSDVDILGLIAKHVATVHVPGPILDEVTQLSAKLLIRLGLNLLEPSLSQVAVASQHHRAISFQDRLCLIVARDGGWHCLTNDKALRNQCKRVGVPCVWGLEVMRWLVRDRQLPARRALSVAASIRIVNPYITQEILDRFRGQI
ncbi:hypothetical protein LCGC14_2245640, partial [marine sediment metagenome]